MKKAAKKGKIAVISILGVVIVLALVFVLFFSGNNTAQGYSETKPVTQSIVTDQRFTGVIESQSREDITATQAMKISDIYVTEGEQVDKDTLLFDTTSGEEYNATVNGEVSKINFEEDDSVTAGEKIMSVVDYTNLQVTIKVDEYEISNIQVGLPVTIKIDSIGRSAEGVVSEVSREAVNENGVSYFTAIVDFQGDSNIRIGMNAEVIIEKERVDNALTVPMEAIQFYDNNEPYVLVKNESGKTEERAVTTGINDGTNVQIIEGLTENDQIMIPKTVASQATTGMGAMTTSGGGN